MITSFHINAAARVKAVTIDVFMIPGWWEASY